MTPLDDEDDNHKRSRNSNNDTPFELLPQNGEHKRAVSSVALSSSVEKPLVASACADGSCKIWDINLQNKNQETLLLQPRTTLLGHSRGINDVVFSRTNYIATASDDKTLRLWDAETGDALVEFRGHENFVFCVKFNRVGNLLVSGGFDETVKLWDVRTGSCISTLPAHSDPVTGVDFNRDGTCVVSGSHDGLLRVWDVATGECLKTIYAGGNPPVSHVECSPNGKYVLVGTLDNKLRLWHLMSGETQHKVYQCKQQHVNTRYCVASTFCVANQRNTIVTGSETGSLVLYGINTKSVQQVLEGGHEDAVLAVASHPTLELLASGGMTKDKTVRFWRPKENNDNDGESSKKRKVEEETK